jgi:hypothetical protein
VQAFADPFYLINLGGILIDPSQSLLYFYVFIIIQFYLQIKLGGFKYEVHYGITIDEAATVVLWRKASPIP